jgi:hypothetical protein
MSRLIRLRSLIIPTCIVILLIIAGAWFNFSWVPSNRRDLDDRNLRVLNTLSEQISHTINSFDKIMDNAVESGIGRDNDLNKYLANVAPELKVPEKKESGPVIGEDYSDPPKNRGSSRRGNALSVSGVWQQVKQVILVCDTNRSG